MTGGLRWLTPRMVIAFHRETLHRHGGGPGMRDAALLDSALARPRNRAAYDPEASVFDLAAEYCAGIVGNHPFVDGNKRTGYLAAHGSPGAARPDRDPGPVVSPPAR